MIADEIKVKLLAAFFLPSLWFSSISVLALSPLIGEINPTFCKEQKHCPSVHRVTASSVHYSYSSLCTRHFSISLVVVYPKPLCGFIEGLSNKGANGLRDGWRFVKALNRVAYVMCKSRKPLCHPPGLLSNLISFLVDQSWC